MVEKIHCCILLNGYHDVDKKVHVGVLMVNPSITVDERQKFDNNVDKNSSD